MSVQTAASSSSILTRYSLIFLTCASLPLASSFCSMEDTIRHDALLAPITFLYATDSKLRSSTDSSMPNCCQSAAGCVTFATSFMKATISSVSNHMYSYRRNVLLVLRVSPCKLGRRGRLQVTRYQLLAYSFFGFSGGVGLRRTGVTFTLIHKSKKFNYPIDPSNTYPIQFILTLFIFTYHFS